MAPKLRDPSDAEEWLRRARSNLARAHADVGLPDVLFEDLCFDASQAAEKAVKAILVHRVASFPKTHSLSELLTLAASAGVDLPIDILDASRLTHYAVTTRYPGLAEEVTREEYVEALRLAVRVVHWAEGLIGGTRGPSDEGGRS
jgi:HEPN domain-containing protein